MDYSMPKMLIFMFTVSLVFTMANTGIANTFGGEYVNYTINVSDVASEQNLTQKEVDISWGFLGPLIILWDFVKKLGTFFMAPVVFLNKVGAPTELQMMIAVPWGIAWVFAIAGFIRGWRP